MNFTNSSSFESDEMEAAKQTYSRLKYRRSLNINDNNLCKFHLMLNDKIHQLKEKEIEQKDLMLKSMKLVRLRLRPINDRYSIQSSKRVSIPKTINQKDIKKKTSRLELNVLSTT